jgi:hypothetical protein
LPEAAEARSETFFADLLAEYCSMVCYHSSLLQELRGR